MRLELRMFPAKLPATARIKAEQAKACMLRALTDMLRQYCRNPERVKKAKQQVQEAGRSSEVSSYIADLGDLQQIREFAQQVQKDHPEIDVLINNAGESLLLRHVQLAWPGRYSNQCASGWQAEQLAGVDMLTQLACQVGAWQRTGGALQAGSCLQPHMHRHLRVQCHS